MSIEPCKICGHELHYVFSKEILRKYKVSYFQCKKCCFLQTEQAFWLEEAYKNPIANSDVGLVKRNIYLSDFTEEFIQKYLQKKDSFMDYAGGYGLFVRLMRDKGYNFFRYDPLCENLFAKGLDAEIANTDYDLITAFEVFEHLQNPIDVFELLLKNTKVLLFSTELQPLSALEQWPYIAPLTGQHISFYSIESLKFIAQKFDKILYTNQKGLHVLSAAKLHSDPFENPNFIARFILRRKISEHRHLSLTSQDYLRSIQTEL